MSTSEHGAARICPGGGVSHVFHVRHGGCRDQRLTFRGPTCSARAALALYTVAVNEISSHSTVSVSAIERPHPNLFKYYLLQSFLLGPLFFLILIPRYFRYHTLRYRFDDEGVSMRWGILFRREISLNYSRVQDIHLSSNFIERWLRLARIEVQTASGSASAEMTIEGVLEYEQVRDFLYSKMRGASDQNEKPIEGSTAPSDDDLATILRQVASELRSIREELEKRP